MQCGENSPQFLQNAETDHKKGYPDAQKGDFRASQKNPDWIHVNTDFLLQKQARKPRSYASPKLCPPTYLLTHSQG